jgi:coenzyme F420-dependent glucose-6-phosphate dehydrogenase
MLERFDQGLEAITRLWDGETLTMDAGWFRLKNAKLYTRAAQRPKLYVSAFGPKAAAIAGKYGDGLWSLGDPEAVPEIVEGYRKACSDHGREPGEIILQSGFCLHDDEQAAIDATRKWKATQLGDSYLRDFHDPAEMYAKAEEKISDEEFAKEGFIVTASAEEAAGRVREIADLGATVVCLQGIGDIDPVGSVERFGREVLPQLR